MSFENGYKALAIQVAALRDLMIEKFESLRRENRKELDEIKSDLAELKASSREHDKRLTKVERVIWLMTGLVVTFVFPCVIYIIIHFLQQVLVK